ncbi:DUF2470 domain-containing protein [Streptomyces aidingensis]|uniref:DUF2470 domain-containing protein n=1 Tax=Streptomyces aidingensis TaxID=910347 RepID=A0A1I1P6I5_9ACTN|nr:DUF2470 domain-containing protein [Streptomyces aidingensis]SFD05419.1 hypothetical protein SAMN05421773_1092 [Streptomyces aidingensis]
MDRPGVPVPGRPRPLDGDDEQRPSAAERLRTLAESNASGVLVIPGAGEPTGPDGLGGPEDFPETRCETRAVDPAGRVLLLVAGDSPAARALRAGPGGEPAGVLNLTDVAPVAVPHRVRGRAALAGWLTAVPDRERAAALRLLDAAPDTTGVVLRLEAGEGHVHDLWGESAVEPEEFAAAVADPLAPHEAELLQHLAAAHGDRLARLCVLLDGRRRGRWERMAPVALDRFGLRVRFWAGDSGFDARFDFAAPVADTTALRHAMHHLFTTALS